MVERVGDEQERARRHARRERVEGEDRPARVLREQLVDREQQRDQGEQ